MPETGSPFAPASLRDLFFQPRRYFTAGHDLWNTAYVLLVGWLVGISYAIERVDYNAFRAEMGRPRGVWASLGPALFSSWGALWLFVLALGAISGPLIWLIGGWWFRVRLRWSGVPDANRREARLVYLYAYLVDALPQVLLLVAITLVYENYAAHAESEELWSLVGLIFPFWSCVVGYAGATARFGASRAKAFVWFVALPWVFYVVALGIIGALVFWMEA